MYDKPVNADVLTFTVIETLSLCVCRSGSVSTLRADSPEHCGASTQGADIKLQEPDYSLRMSFSISVKFYSYTVQCKNGKCAYS